MTKKVILFDLDDTLFNRDDYINKSYEYICAELNFPQIVATYMKREYKNNGETNIFQKTKDEFSLDNKIVEKMIDLYRESKIDIRLHKDAEDFLKNNLKYRLALLTNGGEKTQINKIRLLNIQNYFEEIIITGSIFEKKDWKPSNAPFKYIVNKMNVKENECLYVGDRVETDVIGAFNANITPILVNRNSSKKIQEKFVNDRKYFEINSLDQLYSVIDKYKITMEMQNV